MDWMEMISLVLNLVLGGGLIVTIATLRSQKIAASANAQIAVEEARADEIKNVESAIKIWREMAECMADKYDSMSIQVDNLTREVARLNRINNRIVNLLDKITPENMEHIVAQIKDEISTKK